MCSAMPQTHYLRFLIYYGWRSKPMVLSLTRFLQQQLTMGRGVLDMAVDGVGCISSYKYWAALIEHTRQIFGYSSKPVQRQAIAHSPLLIALYMIQAFRWTLPLQYLGVEVEALRAQGLEDRSQQLPSREDKATGPAGEGHFEAWCPGDRTPLV